jgi:hypothetical protein
MAALSGLSAESAFLNSLRLPGFKIPRFIITNKNTEITTYKCALFYLQWMKAYHPVRTEYNIQAMRENINICMLIWIDNKEIDAQKLKCLFVLFKEVVDEYIVAFKWNAKEDLSLNARADNTAERASIGTQTLE